ncbi:hypothetical protein NDU88_007258 [Pleurodeles waltl]|uniref:Uncharacterized protein n=1 Tax=Pleurodeles waltl TaxID=8319 RepID=A0AAV7U2I4_PLEWA|nr:hypothetical protein NDU88_007258 [Pleurodeles waltl]
MLVLIDYYFRYPEEELVASTSAQVVIPKTGETDGHPRPFWRGTTYSRLKRTQLMQYTDDYEAEEGFTPFQLTQTDSCRRAHHGNIMLRHVLCRNRSLNKATVMSARDHDINTQRDGKYPFLNSSITLK